MRLPPLRPTPCVPTRTRDGGSLGRRYPAPPKKRMWAWGLGMVLLPAGLAAEQLTEDPADASAARFYEQGRQLADQGRWEEALTVWDEARDQFATHSARDPRIGIGYLELATEQEATEFYGTASEMLLWALSRTPIDEGREALRLELERVRAILPEAARERWEEWDDAPDEDVAMRLKRFWVEKDPTPTSPENERLIEHWLRIHEARRRFTFNTRSVIGTDDRGLIFLRFGEPGRSDNGFLGASEQEMRIRLPGGRHSADRAALRRYDTNPQYEVWVYDRLNDQGFTYFLFGNIDGTGPFELVDGVHELIPPAARSAASARNVAGGVPAEHYLQLFYYQDLSVVGGHFGRRFGELERLWNLYTERRRSFVSATGAAPNESELEALEFRFRDEDEFNPPNPPQIPVLSEFEGRARDEIVAQMVRTLSDDGTPLLVLLSTSAPRLTADRRSAYRQQLDLPGWTMRHAVLIRDENLDEVGRLVQPVDPRRADVAAFVLRHVPRPLHLTVTAQTLQQAPEIEGEPRPDTLVESNRLPGQVHLVPGTPLNPDTAHIEMSDLLTGTPLPPGMDLEGLPYDVLPARTLWRRDPLRVYLELYHLAWGGSGADVVGDFRVVPLKADGTVDEDRDPVTLDDVR
ncbi:MAG: GWxTD domain-containing protein, partial [Gemmatimonadetes bacterium]|nr:GWxTD domain-containing protein [Gemmatimonadota bacterium]